MDDWKDMIEASARWMLDECRQQNRRWNTVTDGDLIVGQAYERLEADAVARGIPESDVMVTHGELLTAMQDMARAEPRPEPPKPDEPVMDEAPHEAEPHSGDEAV